MRYGYIEQKFEGCYNAFFCSHIAKKYAEVIEKIKKTTNPKELQILEEKRVELHWKFIDMLKKQGIEFKDRDHATRIAIRINHGEL